MKTQVIQKQGRNTETFTFTYKCEISGDDKEIKVVIQEPNFEETCEAYKYIYDENGKIDMMTPGKLIFDLCALDISPELLTNPRLLMSICGALTTKYALPITTELKKKA